jgi:hypothetical protein
VGPRAGLNRCGKSRPTGIRSPDRPARSQSLYRLRYPAHKLWEDRLNLRRPAVRPESWVLLDGYINFVFYRSQYKAHTAVSFSLTLQSARLLW